MAFVPARYYHLVFTFILSALMSCLVSLVTTLSHLGFSVEVWGQWMVGWSVSFPIAFPAAYVVVPVTRRLVNRIVHADPPPTG